MIDPLDLVLIHQLLGRYGHTIDQGRWDEFADLFVPEASIDYQGGSGRTIVQGRDEVVAWFRSVEAANPPAHHVTNIVVDDQADPAGRVDVHSKFIAPFTRPQHVPRRLYGGDYHDVVVKTDLGWRFAHKQCIPTWQLAVVEDEEALPHRRTY